MTVLFSVFDFSVHNLKRILGKFNNYDRLKQNGFNLNAIDYK